VIVTSAFVCSRLNAYTHPTDCYWQMGGMQNTLNEDEANDDNSEPAQDPQNSMESSVETTGTNTSSGASSWDIWSGLSDVSTASGGGTAYKEAEIWHHITMTGTWSFDHRVEQTVHVYTNNEVYQMSMGTASSTARARAIIRDDRAQNQAVLIVEGSGGDGEKLDGPKKIKTPNSPDLFAGGHNGWLNLRGTTIAAVECTWRGRAVACAASFAQDDIVIVINNLLDVG